MRLNQLYYSATIKLLIVVIPVYHKRTKHIELDCHAVREKFKLVKSLPSLSLSHLQLADVFTKALGGNTFIDLIKVEHSLHPGSNLRGTNN